jgi:hypothetical protein
MVYQVLNRSVKAAFWNTAYVSVGTKLRLMVYQTYFMEVILCFKTMAVARKWPVGQVVKTEASHAFNIGSNPVRVTNLFIDK